MARVRARESGGIFPLASQPANPTRWGRSVGFASAGQPDADGRTAAGETD